MSILSNIFGSKAEPITLERFNQLRTAEPLRLCFGTSKKLSKGSNGPAFGFLNLTFRETIERLLPWRLERKDARYGPYRIIRSEEEYDEIERWINENSDVVFIRSLLAVCVAANEHQSAPGLHTSVGELERRAKYQSDQNARCKLLDILETVFRRLFANLQIDAVCAVPASRVDQFCLPVWLATGLSERLGLEDLSQAVRWAGTKSKMKEVEVDQKWAELEGVGLCIDGSVEGRRILIIDDLYQSGATVHFVASKLQLAGANEIHCIAVVKSLRDTDNT